MANGDDIGDIVVPSTFVQMIVYLLSGPSSWSKKTAAEGSTALGGWPRSYPTDFIGFALSMAQLCLGFFSLLRLLHRLIGFSGLAILKESEKMIWKMCRSKSGLL